MIAFPIGAEFGSTIKKLTTGYENLSNQAAQKRSTRRSMGLTVLCKLYTGKRENSRNILEEYRSLLNYLHSWSIVSTNLIQAKFTFCKCDSEATNQDADFLYKTIEHTTAKIPQKDVIVTEAIKAITRKYGLGKPYETPRKYRHRPMINAKNQIDYNLPIIAEAVRGADVELGR